MKIGSRLSRTVEQAMQGSSEKLLLAIHPHQPLNKFSYVSGVSRRASRRRRLALSKPDRNFINMGLGKMDRERGKSIGSSRASSDRAVSRWPGGARTCRSPPPLAPQWFSDWVRVRYSLHPMTQTTQAAAKERQRQRQWL